MRIRPIITLGLIIGMILLNYYVLYIKWFPFTGIILGVLVLYAVITSMIVKIYKKKKKLPQEENSYCFPDPMARFMKKIDMRTQYESSLLSMAFILVGLIAFTVYMIFLTEFSFWFKFFTGFNSFWGAVFMFSYLISTYQQYISYMESQKIQADFEKASLSSGEMLPLNTMPLLNNQYPQLPKLDKTISDPATQDINHNPSKDENLNNNNMKGGN